MNLSQLDETPVHRMCSGVSSPRWDVTAQESAFQEAQLSGPGDASLAPNGATYVMQSMSRHVDPDLEIEQLPNLGQRLNLPAGWQYQVRTLAEDLVVPARGDAHIVFDEFEDNYQRHS